MKHIDSVSQQNELNFILKQKFLYLLELKRLAFLVQSQTFNLWASILCSKKNTESDLRIFLKDKK
jgi:hypothetical protein